MKKALIIAVAAMLSMGAMAQNNKFSAERLNKLTSRAEMQKARQQRQAPAINRSKFIHDGTATITLPESKGMKAVGDTVWASQMPTNRWFPGEWEEVQAIVVTWPYTAYPAGHAGDEDYNADIYLPGQGSCYQWNYNTEQWSYTGWGAVVGVPDTADYMALLQEAIDYFTPYLNGPYASMAQQYIDEYTEYYNGQEDFRNVFVNLIDAIQHGTQVWITVWDLADSTLIKNFMTAKGKPLTNYRFIENYTNAFWYRDCGPICFYYGDQDSIAMLNFLYNGRACDDLLPDSISSQTGIPNYTTTIKWEGGNCLVDGAGKLFTSDATYDKNADTVGQIYFTGNVNDPVDYLYQAPLQPYQVKDSLQRMIGTEGTYIMPRLRYDGGTGHIDLYADMLDENQFVFSKYPTQYSSWVDYSTAANNIDSMTSWQSFAGVNYTKDYIPFPRKDDGSFFSSPDEYNGTSNSLGYTRSYSNHTFINNIIVQPCFSEVVNWQPTAAWDLANMDSLRAAYPGYTIYPIDIRSFDGLGGAIHCITKQIPAESPIRILHSPLMGMDNATDTTVTAHITNNTGIAAARLIWRTNGGQWDTVAMTAGSDSNFSAVMSLAQLSGHTANDSIDYFISVTSNGGKTITKPMTANNGAYFHFTVNSHLGIAENANSDKHFGQFYPNPATERADMVIEMGSGKNYSVTIYDLSGREVHATSLKAQGTIVYSVNAARMATGQYTVVFSNGSERVVRKLIVK